MAEVTLKDLVERMKAEGALTRNTGTNSIKSLKEVTMGTNTDLIQQIQENIRVLEESAETEERQRLIEEFAGLRDTLQNPELSDEERQIALQQLKAVEDSQLTEEEKKEKEALLKENSSMFERLASSVEGLGEKLNGLVDNAGTGIVGLGAALLLFNPELFMDILLEAVEIFEGVISSISGIFSGDINPLMEFIKENTLAAAGILAVAAIKFGIIGKAIALVTAVTTGVAKAVAIFKAGMAGLAAVMGVLKAAVIPAIVAAAPIIAIVGAITAGIVALTQAFGAARDKFEETGSITQTMLTFITDLWTAPIRWIKSLASWVLGKLGFEETATKLDEFDITETMTSAITGWVGSAIGWIKEKFVSIVSFLEPFWAELTDGMGIFGLITAPVRGAVDWIAAKFGFEAPEGEEGFLTQILMDAWENIKEVLNGLIPSLDDLKGFASKLNPLNLFSSDEEESDKKEESGGGIFSSFFGGGDETKTTQTETATPEAQQIEAVMATSPILDTQVENNALRAEQEGTVVVASMPQQQQAPTQNNVTAPTVNMTNQVEDSFFARTFSFLPSF